MQEILFPNNLNARDIIIAMHRFVRGNEVDYINCPSKLYIKTYILLAVSPQIFAQTTMATARLALFYMVLITLLVLYECKYISIYFNIQGKM